MAKLSEENISYLGCNMFNLLQASEIVTTVFNRHLTDIGKEWKRKEKADFADLQRMTKRSNEIFTSLMHSLFESEGAVKLDDKENPTYSDVHDALREEGTATVRILLAVDAALRNKGVKAENIEKYLLHLAGKDNQPPQEVLELFSYK